MDTSWSTGQSGLRLGRGSYAELNREWTFTRPRGRCAGSHAKAQTPEQAAIEKSQEACAPGTGVCPPPEEQREATAGVRGVTWAHRLAATAWKCLALCLAGGLLLLSSGVLSKHLMSDTPLLSQTSSLSELGLAVRISQKRKRRLGVGERGK